MFFYNMWYHDTKILNDAQFIEMRLQLGQNQLMWFNFEQYQGQKVLLGNSISEKLFILELSHFSISIKLLLLASRVGTWLISLAGLGEIIGWIIGRFILHCFLLPGIWIFRSLQDSFILHVTIFMLYLHSLLYWWKGVDS